MNYSICLTKTDDFIITKPLLFLFGNAWFARTFLRANKSTFFPVKFELIGPSKTYNQFQQSNHDTFEFQALDTY